MGHPHATSSTAGVPVHLSQKIEAVMDHFDLELELATDLVTVASVASITVVADDSGSMSTPSVMPGVPLVKNRWQELQETLRRLLELLLFLGNDGGFELAFLNSKRPGDKGPATVWITSAKDLEAVWKWASPKGRTPLIHAVEQYTQHYGSNERIMMVMTDGSPTDGSFKDLRSTLRKKRTGVYVNFVMCTDDDDVVNAYESSIDDVKHVDVHDDYQSEKNQVEQCGGRLSYNSYLSKCILGARLAKYDNMDDGYMNATKVKTASCSPLCSVM